MPAPHTHAHTRRHNPALPNCSHTPAAPPGLPLPRRPRPPARPQDEYDLATDICDMAAGGQILMGPKTYQRCARGQEARGSEGARQTGAGGRPRVAGRVRAGVGGGRAACHACVDRSPSRQQPLFDSACHTSRDRWNRVISQQAPAGSSSGGAPGAPRRPQPRPTRESATGSLLAPRSRRSSASSSGNGGRRGSMEWARGSIDWARGSFDTRRRSIETPRAAASDAPPHEAAAAGTADAGGVARPTLLRVSSRTSSARSLSAVWSLIGGASMRGRDGSGGSSFTTASSASADGASPGASVGAGMAGVRGSSSDGGSQSPSPGSVPLAPPGPRPSRQSGAAPRPGGGRGSGAVSYVVHGPSATASLLLPAGHTPRAQSRLSTVAGPAPPAGSALSAGGGAGGPLAAAPRGGINSGLAGPVGEATEGRSSEPPGCTQQHGITYAPGRGAPQPPGVLVDATALGGKGAGAAGPMQNALPALEASSAGALAPPQEQRISFLGRQSRGGRECAGLQ